MLKHAYRQKSPENLSSCAVFSAAHSGMAFPDSFLAQADLSVAQLRSSEDAFVDRFIADVPKFGASMLAANFSRAYVDLNRAASELDPLLVRGLPPQKTNPRVAVGLGVLPRVVAGGKIIQRHHISIKDAQARLDHCYHPYHSALKNLIARHKQQFGMCLLFDFHSMPNDALNKTPAFYGQTADIILGDRFGLSCDHWLTDTVEQLFVATGFKVVRNTPFAGGHITRHYGKPKLQVHAIQIEINRSLYMNEKRIEPLPEFEKFQKIMSDIARDLARLGPAALEIAAE